MTEELPNNAPTSMRFWSSISHFLEHHIGLAATSGLVITLVLGLGLTRLNFATGQDSYLNPDDQVLVDNIEYQELFGGQAVLVLFTMNEDLTVADLLSNSNQAEMSRITEDLERNTELIANVVTPLTALEWTDNLLTLQPDGQPTDQPTKSIAGRALLTATENDPSDQGRAARATDALKTAERLSAIPSVQRTMENRKWIEFLLFDNTGSIRKAQVPIFPDRSHAQIVVRLAGNASIETEFKGAQLVRDTIEDSIRRGFFSESTTTVTGASFLLGEINEYLKGGMLQLGLIAIVVMVVLLLVLFDVRWRLLPMMVVLIGVTWAFGLAGYLGIPLSLVTIAGLPVMLGIGIDYAIQLHARIEEEIAIRGASDAPARALKSLGPALLVVTGTAIIAFGTMLLARVPMIRELGLLLACGIALICVVSITIPTTAIGWRERRSPSTFVNDSVGVLGRLTVTIGSAPSRFAPFLIAGAALVITTGALVEGHLNIQSDPIEWVNQSSRNIKDFRTVERETGSSSELSVFIQTSPESVFTQETVDFISNYSRNLLTQHGNREKIPPGRISPELLSATSLVTTVSGIIDLAGASPVNPRADDVRAAYSVAPEAIRKSTVNEGAGAQNLVFRYGDRSLEERSTTVNGIRNSTTPPEGIRAVPSGLAVVGVGLLENLQANRVILTYAVLIMVMLFLTVRLRSVTRSLLSLIPVLLAVGVANIVAFSLNLHLSPMTAIGGPIVVAVCSEFTTLILLRYMEERNAGHEPRNAFEVTAQRTGRAFIVSGLTAVSGVAIIASSSLPLLRDFGLVVGMNVIVALLCALIALPPILIWADDRGWVSKGLVRQDFPKEATPRITGPESQHTL